MDYRTSAWGLWNIFRFAVGTPWASSTEMLREAERKGWVTDADAPGERIDALEAALRALVARDPESIAQWDQEERPPVCHFCRYHPTTGNEWRLQHSADCPWVKAKALLDGNAPGGDGTSAAPSG